MNNFGNSNENHQEEYVDNLPKIRVVVRKRPLNKKETQKNDADIIEIRRPQTVIVREMKSVFFNFFFYLRIS
jgi:hypothetical protein